MQTELETWRCEICGDWVAALGPWECERPLLSDAIAAVKEANGITVVPHAEGSSMEASNATTGD